MVPKRTMVDSEGISADAKALRVLEHNRTIHMWYRYLKIEARENAIYNHFKRGR